MTSRAAASTRKRRSRSASRASSSSRRQANPPPPRRLRLRASPACFRTHVGCVGRARALGVGRCCQYRATGMRLGGARGEADGDGCRCWVGGRRWWRWWWWRAAVVSSGSGGRRRRPSSSLGLCQPGANSTTRSRPRPSPRPKTAPSPSATAPAHARAEKAPSSGLRPFQPPPLARPLPLRRRRAAPRRAPSWPDQRQDLFLVRQVVAGDEQRGVRVFLVGGRGAEGSVLPLERSRFGGGGGGGKKSGGGRA